jgi:hypothetical protein
LKKLLLFLAFFFAVSTEAQTNTARMLSGVNAQTGTSYTFVCTDATKLVTFNNGSAVAATLFAANDPCSGPGIMFSVKNIGTGTVTITPTSGTINGTASLVLQSLQGADIWNDGANYTAQGSTSSGPAPPPGFPRLDQVTDQNTNKSFNQGNGTLAFTGGPGLDLSGETSSMSIPVVAGCTTTSNGQICFDPVGINIHGYNGTDSIVPLFSPSSVTSGDIAGFLLSGGQWTLTDLGPPSSSSGGTVITAQITNISEGDTICWDSTAVPPTFVNCTPGVPPIVVSATSYTFDGTERGEILYFTAAGAKAISLPQASDTSSFDANWFTFVKNDGAGLATITATTSTFFSTGTNTLTISQGIGCSIFSDPTVPGKYYDRCSSVPLTASTNITLTPAAYAISIAAAGGGGGTITGAGTANHDTKWTGAATVGNGCGLDDGTTAVRCDNGYDVNQLGAYLWWATNNAATGTTLNKLACDDGTGKAIICPFASSTTNNPLGVAVAANGAAPGTTGSTGICIIGFCSVIMDNGATAGHYAQSSTTVNGDLSDVGTTIPTNGQSYWYIYSGNAGAGTAAIIRNLTPSELNASSISGGNGRNLQVSVNGTATTKNIKNFNSTTPAAGANNQNLVVQTSAAGNTDSISLEVPLATTGQAGLLQLAGGLGGTSASPTLHSNHGLSFSIGDPAGAALTAGSTTTNYLTIPFACTINAYNLLIDGGTITVKFWKIATGTAIPTSGNSINTSGVGISSGTAIHSTSLGDFTTTAVAANDIMAMSVTVTATAKFVNGVLSCQE